MSKTITLPLGMSSSDVNIGTLTFVGGRTFSVTDIKMESVSGAINIIVGGGPYNLSNIGTPALWSAFKPTKNINFPSGLIVSNQEIIYDPPTSNIRLGDFAGYNSRPPTPNRTPSTDSFTFSSSVGSTTRSITLTLPEIDIRNGIEGLSTSFVRTISQKYINGSWINNSIVNTSITDAHVTNKSMSVNYSLTNQSSTYSFKVLIWLGDSIAKWSPHDVSGTATYLVPTLSVSPTSINVPGGGGLYSISVTSNVSWAAITDSWISITSGGSGTGNGTTTISILQNFSSFERLGEVSYTGDGGTTATVIISQAPGIR